MNQTDKQPDKTDSKLPEVRQPVKQPKRAVPSKSRRRLVPRLIIIVVLCLLAGLAGAQIYSMLDDSSGPLADRLGTSQTDGNQQTTSEQQNIASVVEQASPSVVSIVTTSETMSYYGTAEREGAGTGIIIGSNGYIMTNKHVVQGVDNLRVVLSDGTSYEDEEVSLLGADPLNDIAFLKIDGVSDLPTAELGDSTSVRVGQRVVAIGNSLGQYQTTVTSGIISGTGRFTAAQSGDSVERLTDLLQTDAAINPGNSGGPLLNLSGQVIGINTAIVQDAQGIGFAIPIGATKGIIKGLQAGKPVQRSYLGVAYVPVTAEVASGNDLSARQGAYVFSQADQSAVASGSPADEAGIQDGDVITEVGDMTVGEQAGLSSLIGEYAPGETVELTVVSDGETSTVRVTLAAYQD